MEQNFSKTVRIAKREKGTRLWSDMKSKFPIEEIEWKNEGLVLFGYAGKEYYYSVGKNKYREAGNGKWMDNILILLISKFSSI